MYGYAIMNFMNLFARLSIYDANFVISVIQLTGQQQQMPGDFLGDILDKWLDKVRKRSFPPETMPVVIDNPISLTMSASQEQENWHASVLQI